jgi:hypothetical protein
MLINKNKKSDCRASYSMLQKTTGIGIAWAAGEKPAAKEQRTRPTHFDDQSMVSS